MNLVIGTVLLVTYFLLIYYAAKGGNLMIGFLGIGVIWTGLCILGGKTTWSIAMVDIFQSGPESWGATAVNVIFGCWFGRILVDTGIAAKLIRTVTELGGDNPKIVAILLSLATGVIFTSTYGAGAVVAIGVIVIPILMSFGVSRVLALSSYLMSVGSAMYINSVLFRQMQTIFPEMTYSKQYITFAFSAMAVQLIVTALMIAFYMRPSKKRRRAWALSIDVNNDIEEEEEMHAIALVTPIIPTTLSIAFGWTNIPAFIVGSLFGLAITGHFPNFKDASRVISHTFYNGVVDVASLLGFLFVLPIFNKISGVAAPFFEPILGGILPTTTLGLVIAFIILTPLGLFRGPLTIFGAGAATIGVVNAIGSYPIPFLFALIYVPTIAMELSICPTQSWNMWALSYSKVSIKDFLKSGFVWAWVIAAINLVLVYIYFG